MTTQRNTIYTTVSELEEEFAEAFRRLLTEYGSLSELARRSGMTRRAFEKKRAGEVRVTQWDVWALERALEIKAGAKQ